MKILTLNISGFRNVPDGRYNIGGMHTLLIADNTLGKSNFLKAIVRTLEAKSFGAGAIRSGEQKAKIEVVCAEFQEWTPIPGTEYTFKAEIEKDGENETTKFSLKAPNGMVEKKKTVIGSIAGEHELDYNFAELSRTTTGKKKQLEILEDLLDDDTKSMIRAERNKIKTSYDERTFVGQKKKTVEGFIKEAGINPEDFKTHADPKSGEAVKLSKSAAETHNKLFAWVNENVVKWKGASAQGSYLPCKNLLEDWISSSTQWMQQNPHVDTKKHDLQLEEIQQHNLKHERVKMLVKKQNELTELENEYGELTARIDSCRQALEDSLRDLDFPVQGIKFDADGNATYFGKLIDEDNMSTAEIMILEAQVKMAKDPGVKVLLVPRAESLGTKLYHEMMEEARKRGFHALFEQVERGKEEMEIRFTIN